MRRRALLATSGTAMISLFAGCGWFSLNSNAAESGALVVTNHQDTTHIVTVRAGLHGDRPDSDSGGIETPTGTPREQVTARVEIAPGEKLTQTPFISDPGSYFVRAQTEAGLRGASWVTFVAGSEPGTVGGPAIWVDLQKNGQLSVGSSAN
jgi:hypothetical protein